MGFFGFGCWLLRDESSFASLLGHGAFGAKTVLNELLICLPKDCVKVSIECFIVYVEWAWCATFAAHKTSADLSLPVSPSKVSLKESIALFQDVILLSSTF